jgi:predicted RecB family nuclease
MVSGDDIDISATSFVAFQRCPELAASRYRGEYPPDSRPGFAGQLAHRIFARHLAGGPIDGAEAFSQACREEIGSGMNMKVGSLGLKPSQLRGVIEETSALYDRFKAMEFDGFAGAEVSLEAMPGPGVVLKGTIDAVFDDASGWRLVDWKTGGIYEDAGHQLDFYALLWALDRGEPPGRVEAVSVKTGERHDAVPSRDSLQAVARSVAVMVDTLRTSWAEGPAPERRGGPWCRFCPVLTSCEEGAAAVKAAG